MGPIHRATCYLLSNITNTSVDMFIACDVFVYLGDLLTVFEKCFDALKDKGGIFIFSTEYLHENTLSSKNGFILQKCARFAHTISYLERLAKKVGFCVKLMKKSTIRQNRGVPVIGNLVILEKFVE